MLEAAGVPFELAAPEFDEEAAKSALKEAGMAAAALAESLAGSKALATLAEAGDLVLGSDQTLELADGTMLDKPASRDDAFDQLRRLSGDTHHLHSAAVAVQAGERVWSEVESVRMTVRPLSDGFIGRYLEQEYEAVRWSVGCYHVEGRGVQLFERIEGSHFAVQGMPLLPLLGYLRARRLITC